MSSTSAPARLLLDVNGRYKKYATSCKNGSRSLSSSTPASGSYRPPLQLARYPLGGKHKVPFEDLKRLRIASPSSERDRVTGWSLNIFVPKIP